MEESVLLKITQVSWRVTWFYSQRESQIFTFNIRYSLKQLFWFLFFITGIPDCSEEDAELAQSLGLSWSSVLKKEEDGTQTLLNSDEVNSSSHLNMRAELNQLNGYTS